MSMSCKSYRDWRAATEYISVASVLVSVLARGAHIAQQRMKRAAGRSNDGHITGTGRAEIFLDRMYLI